MILGATITGSLTLNGVNLASITGSEASINALNSFTASAATTGSNVFKSNQTVTGSLNITGSLTVVGPITGTVTTASYVLNAVSASYALNATSASFSTNSDLLDGRDSLTFANTGSNSFVGTQNINGAVAITGSLTTTGAITAQTLNVQQVTSSIVYSSGSNVFGNSTSNTQSMTGSVGISGSLAVVGAGTFTENLVVGTTSNGKQINVYASSYGNNGLFNAYGTDGNIKLQMGGLGTTEAFIYTGASNKITVYSGGGVTATFNSNQTTTLSGALSGTSATFSDTTDITANNSTAINLVLRGRASDSIGQMELWNNAKSTRYGYIAADSTGMAISSTQAIPLTFGTNTVTRLTIASTGAATFTIPVESPALGTVCLTAKTSNGANDIFRWYDGATQLGVFKNSGNVGIGTTSPGGLLHVEKTVGADTVGGNIILNRNTSSSYRGGAIFSYYYAANAAGNQDTLSFGMSIDATSPATVGKVKMVLTEGGNVGIGTTSPSEKLHIYGNTTTITTKLENAQASSYSLYQAKSGTGDTWQWGSWNDGSYRVGKSGIADYLTITSTGIITLSGVGLVLGKGYSQTSSSGDTSIVDTGITYNTGDGGGYGRGVTYQVVYNGNPNAGGSAAYFAQYMGIIMVYTGWSGSNVTTYIQYTPLSSGNNIGALTLTPYFWDGSSQVSSLNAYTGGYQIRLRIAGYNSSYVGSDQSVYLIKLS